MGTSEGPERGAETVARRAFVVSLVGLPVWWLLGVATTVPLVLAVVLAWDLWTRPRVALPRHIGWWLLFLLWVLLGLGTLTAVAPGGADEGGGGRALVFAYRFAWYSACTVVLLWLVGTPARRLSDQAVHRVMSSVFVIAVLGGVLGILAPDLAVTTVAERLVPGGLRSNGFVATLVSAEAADVQQVLGVPDPRPKAPFPFTNTWGSVISLTLVFFLATVRAAAPRWRLAALPVLAVAAVPIVLSLNRGLWLALAGGALGVLVLLALRRRTGALVGLTAAVLVCGVAITSTPLGATVASRLDNPHSNDRRSQLVVATVDSMTAGSPVVGYGGTRDVEGTFTSIAGGATAECPACGVPPLGTQGQLWLVLFSQGWVGAFLFLAFFVLALRRTWRCRTVNETVATFVLAIFLLQLTVYDTLGLPMMVVMVAIALVERERGVRLARAPRARDIATVALIGALGAGVGSVVGSGRAEQLRSSAVTVALEPGATPLDGQLPAVGGRPRVEVQPAEPATVDTEAAVLRSAPVLVRVAERAGLPAAELSGSIRVAAPPLSTVLVVTVTLPATRDPERVARTVAQEYLRERQALLAGQRTELRGRLRGELATTDPNDPAWSGTRAYLRAAIDHLAVRPAASGEVLRTSPAVAAPDSRPVTVTSALGVGVLAGIALIRLRLARRWLG